MGTIFFKVMEMSIAALLLMVAVVLIRIPLKKAPKWFMGILWAIVALRLIVPVQVTAHVGFMPDFGNIVNACFNGREEAEEGPVTVNSGINEAVGFTKSVVKEDVVEISTPEPVQVAAPIEEQDTSKAIPLFVQIIWLTGVIIVLGYAGFSYFSIKRKTAASIRYISGDRIYVCDDIDTPFIFGMLKPSIYMPSGLDRKTIKNVIAHEKAHIERYDHIRKQFGFFILAIHWFNPLVWVSYMLFCRDIELACDERVVSRMNILQKKSYAQSLLTCSTQRRMVLAYPLAFGEVGVGTRVKQIFNYRKPTAWPVAALVVICGIISTSSFTKAAEKTQIARIPLVELKDAEVKVVPKKPEVKVTVPKRSDETVRGIKYPIEDHEYSTTDNKQGVVNLPYQEGTDRAVVMIPGSNADSVYVEVLDAQNTITSVSEPDNIQVQVTQETVNVSVSDGNENVTVRTDNPVVKNEVENVGDVLGELNKIVAQDEVLNQVVNEAINEAVDEVYDEVIYDAYDEAVSEVFDEVIDIGLGGLFGLFP